MKLRRARRLGAGALFLCSLAAGLAGCNKSDAEKSAPTGAPTIQAPTLSEPRAAPTKTTNPDSVVVDLQARVKFNESKIGTPDERLAHLRDGANNHLAVAQFLGKVNSYGRAAELAMLLAEKYPSKSADLLVASTRSSLHDWAGSKKALANARAKHAGFGDTANLEAQLEIARGNLQRALVIRSGQAQKRPNTPNLGSLAIIKAELGDTAGAEQAFVQAIDNYLGPSPLGLAWLYFQRGLMWERAGRPARGAKIYELGYQRFPLYAPLVGHLAANLAARDQKARAIEILEPVAALAEDPQYKAQLGQLYRKTGKVEAGDELIKTAAADYARLLSKHPDAFADHAIEFYLSSGADPKRALELAQGLIKNRPVDRSHQLLMQAAAAAQLSVAQRCQLADQASEVRYPSAQLHFLRAQAYQACKRGDDAKTALVAADSAARKQ